MTKIKSGLWWLERARKSTHHVPEVLHCHDHLCFFSLSPPPLWFPPLPWTLVADSGGTRNTLVKAACLLWTLHISRSADRNILKKFQVSQFICFSKIILKKWLYGETIVGADKAMKSMNFLSNHSSFHWLWGYVRLVVPFFLFFRWHATDILVPPASLDSFQAES